MIEFTKGGVHDIGGQAPLKTNIIPGFFSNEKALSIKAPAKQLSTPAKAALAAGGIVAAVGLTAAVVPDGVDTAKNEVDWMTLSRAPEYGKPREGNSITEGNDIAKLYSTSIAKEQDGRISATFRESPEAKEDDSNVISREDLVKLIEEASVGKTDQEKEYANLDPTLQNLWGEKIWGGSYSGSYGNEISRNGRSALGEWRKFNIAGKDIYVGEGYVNDNTDEKGNPMPPIPKLTVKGK